MIRVILVDDVVQVRQALRERLNFEPDIEVIGEAENGETAVGLAARLQPDVVVLDVKMSQGDGITTARKLGAVVPGSRIVMLSLYDDPVNRARAKDGSTRDRPRTRSATRSPTAGPCLKPWPEPPPTSQPPPPRPAMSLATQM